LSLVVVAGEAFGDLGGARRMTAAVGCAGEEAMFSSGWAETLLPFGLGRA